MNIEIIRLIAVFTILLRPQSIFLYVPNTLSHRLKVIPKLWCHISPMWYRLWTGLSSQNTRSGFSCCTWCGLAAIQANIKPPGAQPVPSDTENKKPSHKKGCLACSNQEIHPTIPVLYLLHGAHGASDRVRYGYASSAVRHTTAGY